MDNPALADIVIFLRRPANSYLVLVVPGVSKGPAIAFEDERAAFG